MYVLDWNLAGLIKITSSFFTGNKLNRYIPVDLLRLLFGVLTGPNDRLVFFIGVFKMELALSELLTDVVVVSESLA